MNEIRFSIITASLARQSLVRTCESIDKQKYNNYQHVIVFDLENISNEDKKIINSLNHKNRKLVFLDKRHNDYGNTPRFVAGQYINGEYIMYLDDDDYHINNTMFELNNQLKHFGDDLPDFAIFRCLRMNEEFTHFPPAVGLTTVCQYIHKAYIKGHFAWWPTHDTSRLCDGYFIEFLKTITDPVLLTTEKPLVSIDIYNVGEKI